jgi:hypothetical protein
MKMVMIMSIFHGLSKDPLLNMGPLAVLLKPCFSRTAGKSSIYHELALPNPQIGHSFL